MRITLSHREAIESHYKRQWSEPFDRVRMVQGHISDLPQDFCIRAYNRTDRMSVHATVCMSQPEDEHGLELHVFSSPMRKASPTIVEILTAVSHYHRTGHPLSLGHTVNFGTPWQPGSRCTYGLVSLPYLDGPNLEIMEMPKVRFLWLIPVTEEEVQYKKKFGLEDLESTMEKARFDFMDPSRPSVV